MSAPLIENVSVKDGEVVEHGDVEDVFHHPSHPYTRRLLEALPDLRAAVA